MLLLCYRLRAALLLFTLLTTLIAFTHAQALSDLPNIHSSAALGGPTKQTANPEPTNGPQKTSPDTATTTDPVGLGSNAPTLYGVGIPTPIVPDTSNAPFMQTSNLPQGFVFICVGATLGFLGACVVAWRGLVAWSLRRSVQRAAAAKYASEKTSIMHGKAPPSGYSSLYPSATASVERLSHPYAPKDSNGARVSRSDRPPKYASHPGPNASSLFYSPTAGVTQGGPGHNSSYLPAGYYASGASVPAAGSVASLGGPARQGYGQLDNFSPPSTPRSYRHESEDQNRRSHARSGSRGVGGKEQRSSRHAPRDRSETRRRRRSSGGGGGGGTRTPGQRTPSAMPDDLFDHHTGMRDAK